MKKKAAVVLAITVLMELILNYFWPSPWNVHSIEMHVRMPGDVTLDIAHKHSMDLEARIREELGPESIVNIHIEPLKVDGKYRCE